jgi:hypothetical protein
MVETRQMDKTQHPLLDVLLNATEGDAPEQIALAVGLTSGETHLALNFLVPALMAGLRHNASLDDGMDSLFTALNRDDHAKYLDRPETLRREAAMHDGNAILGHIFGSEKINKNVAHYVAGQTGINPNIVRRLLPLAAAMVMGGLSKEVEATENTGEIGALLNSLFEILQQKDWYRRRD